MALIRFYLAVLGLGIASFAGAQTQSKSPLCAGDSWLLIGEVPNKPFTANIVSDSWETASDGSRKTINLPERNHAYYVARNSQGRVVIRGRGLVTHSGPDDRRSESMGEEETICDPVAGTVTRVSYQDVFYRGVESSTGQTVLTNAGIGGFAVVESQRDHRTTENFTFYKKKVNGRENLGLELFGGVPANRYRFTKTHEEGSLHEAVISEELEADLASIRWVVYPATEQETRLEHIRHREPVPHDFDLPEGVKIMLHLQK